MTSNLPADFCPYKGLQPYTEVDRAFFFGREREKEIIASNLYAAPLTVLYGASGVGKSSVLMAGVVPLLRKEPRLAVITFRTWQDESFLFLLKAQIFDAVSKSAGREIRIDTTLPFDEFLLQHTRALRGRIFIVLDQFEEYFLYQTPSDDEDNFDAAFARAVNRRELNVNFLLALREDGLSKLDRFKGRIPNLLSNTLRLEHLDREAAVGAIRKPLDEYNRYLVSGEPQITIEDTLVDSVINQVQAGQVTLGDGAQGQKGSSGPAPGFELHVEAPYLQLVMTRVWDEERSAKSNTLHLVTLDRLGGAEHIIRTHLDVTMARLASSERLVAARAFRYMVTPSGAKIAYTASDLSNYTGDSAEKVSPVLVKLSRPERRVLRAVASPFGQALEPRYEIFHDVLAPAVLDWRTRYLEQIRTKRLQRIGALLSAIVLVIVVFLSVNFLNVNTELQSAKGVVVAFQTVVPEAQGTGSPTLNPALAAIRETAVALSPGVAQVQASPTPTLSIGSTKTSTDGMVMVHVPAGEFLMGSSDADKNAQANEKPQHTVYLDAFWIDKFDVTDTLYNKCVDAGPCSAPLYSTSRTRSSYYGNSQYNNFPVIYVSWDDATTYCTWAGKKLPTEAQWEKAARGTDGSIYPWGNIFDMNLLNSTEGGKGDTVAVGSYPGGASPYGVMDMAGNVLEWVADWYDANYYSNSPRNDPKGPTSKQFRVVRGGSFLSPQNYVRAARRLNVSPGNRFSDIGFRCAE